MLFDRESEGQQHLDVFLDVLGGLVTNVGVFPVFVVVFIEEEWGVEAEVDANVAILFEGGVVKVGAEGEELDRGGKALPAAVEAGFAGLPGPEPPLHLELVDRVFVEYLHGFGNGVFDERVLLFNSLGAGVEDVLALVDGWRGEADRVRGGGGDPRQAGDAGELAQDGDYGFRQGGEAEVGKPDGEVELIGHPFSLVAGSGEYEHG